MVRQGCFICLRYCYFCCYCYCVEWQGNPSCSCFFNIWAKTSHLGGGLLLQEEKGMVLLFSFWRKGNLAKKPKMIKWDFPKPASSPLLRPGHSAAPWKFEVARCALDLLLPIGCIVEFFSLSFFLLFFFWYPVMEVEVEPRDVHV